MTNKNGKDGKDDVFDSPLNDDMFSDEVMESCNKMLANLTKNPNVINKTVKNFMKTFSGLQEASGDIDESLSSDEQNIKDLLTHSKRILARLIRLEKKLEKAGLISADE